MAAPARIIHQTWKTRELPARARRLARSWREHHPDWEYRLWTDEDNRELIARSYPELLATFDAYTRGVQRADVARLAILHRHGGLYVDVDFECLAPVGDLFPADALSLVHEPTEQARALGMTALVSNALMAAPAGHPVLRRLLDELSTTRSEPERRPPDVLGTTGPIFLTQVLEQVGEESVHWLSSETFFPVPARSRDLDQVLDGEPGSERHLEEWRRRGARAVHYWVSSWARDLHGVLHAPEGSRIEGFVFHPGWDAPGHDLKRCGRDLERIAAECRVLPGAVAFNTDGWIKFYVPRRSLWRRMRWVGPDQGLYVMEGYGTLARLRAFLHWPRMRGGRRPPIEDELDSPSRAGADSVREGS